MVNNPVLTSLCRTRWGRGGAGLGFVWPFIPGAAPAPLLSAPSPCTWHLSGAAKRQRAADAGQHLCRQSPARPAAHGDLLHRGRSHDTQSY